MSCYRKSRIVQLGLFFGTALTLVTPASGQWTTQASGTKARLRGLAVVDANIVWASGTLGTFVRTIDGGTTWKPGTVPGAGDLDFRDVHAVDDHTAFLLSIGDGPKSRIYHTADGGKTWTIRFQNDDPRVFLDALAFWDRSHGIAMGDPVDGHFTILVTDDGGITWKKVAPNRMPQAQKGEGAFAASGTCLVVQGDRNVWFGTGGAGTARVFRSEDRGHSWTVHTTPIRADNPSSGIFSLAFRDQSVGVAVGGDYKQPDQAGFVAAVTSDGGRSWSRPEGPLPAGYRSAVAYLPGTSQPTLVAVGPTGSDFSADGGGSWRALGHLGFHATGFASATAGWAFGDNGLIARFRADADQINVPKEKLCGSLAWLVVPR